MSKLGRRMLPPLGVVMLAVGAYLGMVTALLFNGLAFLVVTIGLLHFRYRVALRERAQEVALPEALPTDTLQRAEVV